MNNIKITYPYLLYVMLPLAALVVLGFFFIPKQKKKRPNNVISLFLHLILACTLSLAFADIRILKGDSKSELYVLVDCSDSERNNIEKIDATVSDIFEKAKANKAEPGLVCFGKNQMVYRKPGESLKSIKDVFDREKYPEFSSESSDIASALTYTKDLFSEDAVKKMVIVSDGVETDNSAVDVIASVLSENITIDAVYLNDTPEEEVSIQSIDYVDRCYTNRQQEVKVLLQSSKEKTAKVRLETGGEIKEEKETTLAPGMNVLTFYVTGTEPGTVEYELEVDADGDSFSENNHVTFSQEYTDKFSVLFIGNTAEDLTAFQAINGYDSNVTIKSYVDTNIVPYKLSDLIQYDEIVLSNINLLTLNRYDEFAKNLNAAVKTYGKSLLTFGATYTTSNGASAINDYNDLLPVQYESDEAKGLVLLIDCSGSMQSDDRLTIAKKGAIKCLDVLSDKDYVSILSFSSNVTIHQPLTSIKNKAEIIKAINGISLGGGTMLGAGLRQAYEQIYESKCEYKNVITLTDGLPSESDSELKRIVRNMASDNIICSFINIASNEGQTLLSNLADIGNGTYYFCRTASGLINIMLSSVSGEIGNTEIEESATIQYRLPNDPVLDKVTNLPDIKGYNYCRIKGTTNTVLTVQYIKKDEKGNTTGVATIPLYAYWNFGKGKVSSFTSNLTSDWTSDFRNSTSGQTFLKNSIYQSLPDRSISTLMDLTTSHNGSTMGLAVKVGESEKVGKIHVISKDPLGSESETDLVYDSKDMVYNGKTPLTEKGKYEVKATFYELQEDGSYKESETDTFYFYYDFSKEYDVLPETEGDTLLNELVKDGNGKLYQGDDVYQYTVSESDISHVSYSSTMLLFFLFSVILYLIDIFIRKSTFRIKKKKKAETE